MSTAVREAIEAHLDRGILFVAAAGNFGTNNDLVADYPSGFDLPNVIAVAATHRTDSRARFSQFGPRTVHIAAPGEDILSTTPGNTYSTFDGTSMASPQVAGVVALLKAHDPSLDWRAIRNRILAGADVKPAMLTVGERRLNAYGALTCSNRVVRRRLRPAASAVVGFIWEPVDLKALHINCASPNGAVAVTVSPGGQVITLRDDGAIPDQVAGDGVYGGQFIPTAAGVYTLTFPDGDVVTARVLGTSYTVQTIASAYRTVTGTNLEVGDERSEALTLPFPIAFGGSTHDTLFVSDNGSVSVDGAVSNWGVYPRIPTVNPRQNTVVAPFWLDLYPPPATDQDVYWAVTGSAPNRELVIEWRNLTRWRPCGDDTAHTVRFQAVFFEANGDILFNYADTSFGGACTDADAGGLASVGVQVAPLRGRQFSYQTTDVTDGLSLLWTPAAAATAPLLGLDPDYVTFGQALMGDFLEKTITVTNLGGETLTGTVAVWASFPSMCGPDPFGVLEVCSGGEPLAVTSGASYSMAPGQSHATTVRFTPTSAEHMLGALDFSSNAGQTLLFVVGNGVDVWPAVFTDPSLTAGTTPVRAVHIRELRTRINAVRVARGLGNFSFTDPTLKVRETTAKGVHVMELRMALDTAYADAGLTPPTYTDPSISLGATIIKAVHILELRAAVVALE